MSYTRCRHCNTLYELTAAYFDGHHCQEERLSKLTPEARALLDAAEQLAKVTRRYILGVHGFGPESVNTARKIYQQRFESAVTPPLGGFDDEPIYLVKSYDNYLGATSLLGYETDKQRIMAYEDKFLRNPHNEGCDFLVSEVKRLK